MKNEKITPRGRILKGRLVKRDAFGSATVKVEHIHYIRKYERYETRTSKIRVHNPKEIDAKVGDIVKIHECKPISKTKHFIITEIIKK
ncbi:30S ribosomal protein S17 [Candidatus Woesearchaeota archaeon]|nr:30S ribosomal protein S17P [uncultured archaeon]MBS3150609.1 30S ribosomal protein S17 [Candidatus Woesearchaeota archaeon]